MRYYVTAELSRYHISQLSPLTVSCRSLSFCQSTWTECHIRQGRIEREHIGVDGDGRQEGMCLESRPRLGSRLRLPQSRLPKQYSSISVADQCDATQVGSKYHSRRQTGLGTAIGIGRVFTDGTKLSIATVTRSHTPYGHGVDTVTMTRTSKSI